MKLSMVWHTGHIKKIDKTYLKYVYNHDQVITLDEVPDIMEVYGKPSFWHRLKHLYQSGLRVLPAIFDKDS